MDNKVFGLTFLAVVSSAFLFFGVANAGSFAIGNWLFPTEEFGDNTYIGTMEVSNMELAAAKSLFSDTVKSWRETAELQVTYQDVTVAYPLDNVEVLLDETVATAESGSQNGFVFQLSEDTTRKFLSEHFPVVNFSDADAEAVNSKLEEALAAGQSLTHINISDDSLSLKRETVSEAVIQHHFENAGAAKLVEKLNGKQIAPSVQFSFLDFVSEISATEVTDSELTQLASAIYAAVLKTNFLIDERSIGTVKPASVPLGQEAVINRPLGIDFAFTNTNKSSFTLNASIKDNSLFVAISGYPFVNTYQVSTGSEQKIEPRLIKQFSAFASSEITVKEPGSEGVRVEVLRTILEDGQEVEVQAVSTDYYPPVHKIELHPLAASIAETPADVETAEETSPESFQLGVDEQGNIILVPKETEAAIDETNETDAVLTPATDQNPAEETLEAIPEPREPEYDKSGNLIQP